MATILIADDDRNLAELLKTALEVDGHKVYVANDGTTGLDKIEKYHPDLCILDVMMPGMEGYDVAYLSKIDRAYKPKVIIISAKSKDFDKQMGRAMGADAYLSKPFEMDVLKLKVRELLAPKKVK
ncbi:MAG: response regulator [Elusimicrobiota bacterium]